MDTLLCLCITRELLIRMQRKMFFENALTREIGVGNLLRTFDATSPLNPTPSPSSFMPNQHAPDKASVGIWIPRTLKRRLEKEAKARKMPLSDLIVFLYDQATRDVELTPEDYLQIAEDTRRATDRARLKKAKPKAENSE